MAEVWRGGVDEFAHLRRVQVAAAEVVRFEHHPTLPDTWLVWRGTSTVLGTLQRTCGFLGTGLSATAPELRAIAAELDRLEGAG